jgi:hypothetical protein
MTSDKPTNPGNAHDLRQLLEAVREAVTIPYNAPEYALRLQTRTDWVLTTLKGLREGDPDDAGWLADYLRNKLAAEEAEAAERAKNRCGRCRRPFDSTDPRFDGHARYAATPYCRRCTDNCRDGGAEHVCVLCDPKRYGGEPR